MANCKDCIHYNVCTELCTGIDMCLLMKDEYADRLCSNFEDKSKYVKLLSNEFADNSYIRRLDDLGRLHIPKAIREKLDMQEGEEIQIIVNNSVIIINPHYNTSEDATNA